VSSQEVPTESADEASVRNEIATILDMWLQWNEAYQNLTQRMYEERTDFHQLEMLADQLDEMRLKAVEKTRRLLTALRKTA
jgi:thioesterase domain-containing protein